MNEVNKKTIYSKETEVKAKEIFALMIDKIHSYFVEAGKEIRVDTAVDLLSALAPVISYTKAGEAVSDFTQSMEEVDIL